MADVQSCPQPPSKAVSDVFVPLVVWFFITIAASAAGGGYVAFKKLWASSSTDDDAVPAGRTGGGRGSALMDLDLDYAAGEAAAKESWAISFKELRFGRRIGVGNVGEVYRGVFRGRTVAIKKLLHSWTGDEGMIARFREEILLMSTMNHPNVLGFVGAVLDPDAGNIALVTELCERGTLYDLLHSAEPLPWSRRLKMARDIAMGMDYLHTKAGIIQRDLKSANLLVTRAYDVRVADFGLSRELAPGRMGTYCGTPATMAPEIVRQEEYSEKADVFSFAIILWELLTRAEPYAGHDGLALAYSVANDGLRPSVPAYCPAEWAAMMVRSWDDDPRVRPSFDELQRELLRLIRLLESPPPIVPLAVASSPSHHNSNGGQLSPKPVASSSLSPAAAALEGSKQKREEAMDARGRFRMPPAAPAAVAAAPPAAALELPVAGGGGSRLSLQGQPLGRGPGRPPV